MSGPKTHYLRVSEKEVLPVEIHSVQKTHLDHTSEDWLRDRHVQEIIQLLHGTVTSYVETKKNKQTTNKQQKPADIVTGSSVRFGYMFRTRPGSQTCLLEEVCSDPSDDCFRSFDVLKDKLVVFAHPLIPGSPKISQLMKVMNVKRQSIGQGVSISSYFQKIPSQNASSQTGPQTVNHSQPYTQESSGSQSVTKAESCGSQSVENENQSASTVAQPPTSEGKRNKIKSILKRGEIGKSRRLRKRGNESQSDKQANEKDVVKKSDAIVIASDLSEDSDHLTRTSSASRGIRERCVESVKITPCASPLASGTTKESYMIGNVQVSRIESPCVNIRSDKDENGDTVTLISVEQMNEIQKEKRTNSVDSIDAQSNMVIDSGNQSEPHSDSSNEMLALPSASFCTEKKKRCSNAIDVKTLKTYFNSYEADVDTDSPADSPKFKFRKSEKVPSILVTNSEENKTVNSIEITGERSGSKKQAHLLNKENGKSGLGHKMKRKFPKFSDSDSEESLPEKRAKTKAASEKFVNLENMKSNSRKLQISNSFFTGDGGKAQPKLSYFVSNKKSLTETEKKSRPKCEVIDEDDNEDIEDIDCELIKELSDFPKIKNEADTELKNEIRAMNSISKLNEEHLQYLIRVNETYLRNIFEGKVTCARHQEYKQGGNIRRDLNFKSRLGQYTEEQVDTVMESLMKIFCKRHHKYLDYIMKVLLPEMLIKLHMDVHGTSHIESEKKLAPRQMATP